LSKAGYSQQAIQQARTVVGGEKGKFGAVGDALPQSVDAGMFGTLGPSATVASAATELFSALRTEYAAAEKLLDGVERALDATERSIGVNEQHHVDSLRAIK
jgi:hypothetical protein